MKSRLEEIIRERKNTIKKAAKTTSKITLGIIYPPYGIHQIIKESSSDDSNRANDKHEQVNQEINQTPKKAQISYGLGMLLSAIIAISTTNVDNPIYTNEDFRIVKTYRKPLEDIIIIGSIATGQPWTALYTNNIIRKRKENNEFWYYIEPNGKQRTYFNKEVITFNPKKRI